MRSPALPPHHVADPANHGELPELVWRGCPRFPHIAEGFDGDIDANPVAILDVDHEAVFHAGIAVVASDGLIR